MVVHYFFLVVHYYTKDSPWFSGNCINNLIHLQLKFFNLFLLNLVISLLPITFTHKKIKKERSGAINMFPVIFL